MEPLFHPTTQIYPISIQSPSQILALGLAIERKQSARNTRHDQPNHSAQK